MHRTVRHSLALTAGAALVAFTPAVASAAPPERPERIHFAFVLPGLVDCGEVALDVAAEGWAQETFRGERLDVHLAYTLTWSNPETGASLGSRGVVNETFDPSGTVTLRGKERGVTVPGYGVVLLSAGRAVLSGGEQLVSAGPKELDETALCAYLT
ncbi:hypothetical protein [Aquipuribacter nitratireducens]|uniref:Uncharacterized protein n=1 Tax=Aquipuribacter nitratireducens TaxID=650104 RepID=A0ABW0GLY9_9MICO